MRSSILFLFLYVFISTIYPYEIKEGERRVEVFANKEGFDQNTISAICSDKNSVLWFATPNGLIKYDGYDFESVQIQEMIDQHNIKSQPFLPKPKVSQSPQVEYFAK